MNLFDFNLPTCIWKGELGTFGLQGQEYSRLPNIIYCHGAQNFVLGRHNNVENYWNLEE